MKKLRAGSSFKKDAGRAEMVVKIRNAMKIENMTTKNQSLAKNKETELAAKARADRRATYIDALRKAGASFAFGYGVLVVFSYCFFNIQFFPSGLSTGDVLFFFFAALGLGLMAFLGAAIGSILYLPATMYGVAQLDTKVTNAKQDWLWIFSPLGLLIYGAIAAWFAPWKTPSFFALGVLSILWFSLLGAYLWVVRYHMRYSPQIKFDAFEAVLFAFVYLVIGTIACTSLMAMGKPGWFLLGNLILSGLSISLGISLIDSPSSKFRSNSKYTSSLGNFNIRFSDAGNSRLAWHSRRLKIALVFFVLPLLPALSIPSVRNYVFSELGVRAESAAVSLDKGNLNILRMTANSAGIPLSFCRGDDGEYVVSPVNVLWHGMGARSLVQVAVVGNHERSVNVELQASGLRVIRGMAERCMDIAEAALFSSGTTDFVKTDNKELKAKLDFLLKPQLDALGENWKIKQMLVIGHSDPMPMPGDRNILLALSRANAIAALLKASEALLPKLAVGAEIESSSAGARSPIKICDVTASQAFQRECNEVNRRVEVRFRLSSPSP